MKNLADVIGQMDLREVQILVLAAAMYDMPGISPGTAAFLEVNTAIKLLKDYKSIEEVSRRRKELAGNLLTKIEQANAKPTFVMYLDDMRVFKATREIKNGSRELILPFKKVATAGLRWNAFKKCYDRPEISVNHILVLRKQGKNTWACYGSKSIESLTKNYLFQQFGLNVDRPKLPTHFGIIR